jgi:hypothetical protein
MFKNIFFRTSCRLWDNLKKYSTAVDSTDDNMAHVRCMLNNQEYKHKIIIWNTYLFSNVTMLAQTCLFVTLQYIACFVTILVGVICRCYKLLRLTSVGDSRRIWNETDRENLSQWYFSNINSTRTGLWLTRDLRFEMPATERPHHDTRDFQIRKFIIIC